MKRRKKKHVICWLWLLLNLAAQWMSYAGWKTGLFTRGSGIIAAYFLYPVDKAAAADGSDY